MKSATKTGLAPSDIDHLVAQAFIQRGHDSGDDIAYECPVAVHVPSVEQGQRHAGAHGRRGSCTSSRRDGEEAQGREIDALHVVVRVAEQLCGTLAGGVGGERAVCGVGLDERHELDVAGRRGRRREHEIRVTEPMRGVQQVERACELHS